ncbi:hypothetical protein PIB30_017637 [Stylosanthes scabra]|uniref:Uncharacterized protein n=1 Tax=Stylosanthes scabra TaxID=79078 RepID=A0ABU6W698_9FABA|nr:hypothetical protein [Stylosanthes scabra]
MGLHRSLPILWKTSLRLLSASILRVAVREVAGRLDKQEASNSDLDAGLELAASSTGRSVVGSHHTRARCRCSNCVVKRFSSYSSYRVMQKLSSISSTDACTQVVANALKGVDTGDTIHTPEAGNTVKRGARSGSLYIKIKLGLSGFFDAVVIGGECQHGKPRPDPYLKGLEALKASNDHAFISEDSISGVKAGVAAEVPVIGITNRNSKDLLMKARPTFLIKDYDDPKLLLLRLGRTSSPNLKLPISYGSSH